MSSYYYDEYGSIEKPLMVLLHGFPANASEWADIANKLSSDFRIIVPDLKGYGRSDKPNNLQEYEVNNLVSDLYLFLKEVAGDQKIILVGHDWGGILAWYMESFHPELISKLVAINAPHPNVFSKILNSNNEQQKLSAYIKLIISKNGDKLVLKNNFEALKSLFTDRLLRKKYITEAEAKNYEHSWANSYSTMLNYYKGNFKVENGQVKSNMIKDLPYNKTSTLLIWGEWDTAFVSNNFSETESISANIKLVKYEKVTHWVIEESKDALINDIVNFVGDTYVNDNKLRKSNI